MDHAQALFQNVDRCDSLPSNLTPLGITPTSHISPTSRSNAASTSAERVHSAPDDSHTEIAYELRASIANIQMAVQGLVTTLDSDQGPSKSGIELERQERVTLCLKMLQRESDQALELINTLLTVQHPKVEIVERCDSSLQSF